VTVASTLGTAAGAASKAFGSKTRGTGGRRKINGKVWGGKKKAAAKKPVASRPTNRPAGARPARPAMQSPRGQTTGSALQARPSAPLSVRSGPRNVITKA
jgi:hypothetical protein